MSRLSFGGFELDPASGELWKAGECLRIQEQPLKLLLCLLERPGELVGREDLQKRVWGEGIHVDFEDGLNAAAWRLRQILGDSPDNPRFIETVPRKGYRFVGKVLPLPGRTPPPSGSFPLPVFHPASGTDLRPVSAGPARSRPWTPRILVGAGLALLGAGALLWGALTPRPVPVVVAPLVNLTGDPAVDYFASALTQQVTQDLAREPDLRVVPPGAGGGRPGALPEGALMLTWNLGRTAEGYRIAAALQDSQHRSRGERVFLLPAADLHEAHRSIAPYIRLQATGKAGNPPTP